MNCYDMSEVGYAIYQTLPQPSIWEKVLASETSVMLKGRLPIFRDCTTTL